MLLQKVNINKGLFLSAGGKQIQNVYKFIVLLKNQKSKTQQIEKKEFEIDQVFALVVQWPQAPASFKKCVC